MSHVDEGALHAYLDGALDTYPGARARAIRAHLERCSRCAAALEEARMLRDEVSGIMVASGLDVSPPPFEEVRRRAASVAGGSGSPAGRVRLARMGWAASVVLALGVGWTLRGGGLPESGAPEGGPAAEVASSVAEGARATRALAASSDAAGAGVAEGVDVAGAGPGARGGGPERAVSESGVRGSVASSAPREREETAAPAVAERLFPESGAVAGVASFSADAERIARIAEVEAATPVAAESDRLLMADGVGPEPVDAAAVDIVAGGAGPVVAERVSAPRPSAVVVSRAEASATGLPATPPDSGPRAQSSDPDEPGSLVVPGLEVISIVWREEGVTPAGVRVLQRLDSGGVLELIHLPEGFAPEAVAPAAEGVSELVVPRGAGWLILRAAVPADTLDALLERLDTPPPI